MKIWIFFILLVLIVHMLYPKKIRVLPDVFKPDMIEVDNDHLYVVEGTSILIYNLKDLKLINKFGKKGEGPGEFKLIPFMSNWLKIFPDFLLVNSYTKILKFSKEGKLIDERRKNVLRTQVTPIGKNFVGKASKVATNDKTLYTAVNLYNSEMKKIKELYYQEFTQQGYTLNLIMDFLNFQVYDDKIFIEESPEGFIIDVFDSEGKKLYRIKKEFKDIKITNDHKKAAFTKFRNEPTIRQILKTTSWETLIDSMTFVFPASLPHIQNIEVTNNRIYIKTFNIVNSKEEYVVMNLKGKVLKRIYLPEVERAPFWHNILGATLNTIKNNKFYYLKENEDEEELELHVEEIKN